MCDKKLKASLFSKMLKIKIIWKTVEKTKAI